MKLMSVVVVLGVAACAPTARDAVPDAPSTAHPDAPGTVASGDAPATSDDNAAVYAHTASMLYRVDPSTYAVTPVGAFGWPGGTTDMMTDIAIDKTGAMVGISYSKVYSIDTSTAQCTLLSSSLNGTYNGMSFVPATMIGRTGDDVLVATNNTTGVVEEIDPTTGNATKIGNMGAFTSSGDLVAVAGFGTVLTANATAGSHGDMLVSLAADTFAATPIGNGIGYSMIWGVAFWKGQIFGFTETGDFITIDPTTGVGTAVAPNSGIAWWGAAVTTIAPVIP